MALNWDTVIENLNELLTNSVNLTDKFYDIFFNPTPMDIDLELYDENNELILVTIPNRAKDLALYDSSLEIIQNLSEVATTGDYNDLIHRPTIPEVGEGILTLTKNGTSIGTFNANQSNNTTVDIVVPTLVSQLENDAEYITAADIPLHGLKGYKDEGEWLKDEEGCLDVSSYACDNFDINNFVTNTDTQINIINGVASGFTNNDYLRFGVEIPGNTELAICGAFEGSQEGAIFSITDGVDSQNKFILSTSAHGDDLIVGGEVIDPSYEFWGILGIRWPYNGTVYFKLMNEKIYLSVDKKKWVSFTAPTPEFTSSGTAYVEIGSWTPFTSINPFEGEIDLKEFIVGVYSISIQETGIPGFEVLTAGNKTELYVSTKSVAGQSLNIKYLEGKTGAQVLPIFNKNNLPVTDLINILNETQGFTPFYLLGIEEAEDPSTQANEGVYSLPRGELYGLIKKLNPEKYERSIGEIVYSAIPLDDANLYPLNGDPLQSTGAYEEFYNYMLNLSLSGTADECFCTETQWQDAVSEYGVCGKFVVTNTYVRIPKYGNKTFTKDQSIPINSTVPVKGNGKNLGLTDGTENFSLYTSPYVYGQTGNYGLDVGQLTTGVNYDGDKSFGVTTDGTKSGLIADLSSLSPEVISSLEGYYYIVIATSSKTSLQVNIDNITTDLANKIDKSGLVSCHVVIDTYLDDTTGYWYRLYDDGWLEQGGSGTTSTATTILPKAYRDTSYQLFIRLQNNNSSVGAVMGYYYADKSTDRFVRGLTTQAFPFDWITYGYSNI